MNDKSLYFGWGGVLRRLKNLDMWLCSLQHFIFGVANAAAVPIVVGSALGLNTAEIATLAQRTFLFAGIASLLQAFLGHKYPIFEGPAGVWYTTFVVLGNIAVQTGMPLHMLRTDLMTGMLAAGVMSIIIGMFGLMHFIRKLFTPLVNSIFLLVMALQFSSTLAHGLVKTVNHNSVLDLTQLVVFMVVIVTILFLSLKAHGFLRNVAVLVGTLAGWIAAYIVGSAPPLPRSILAAHALLAWPQLLAWGLPSFNLGVTITMLLAGIVVLSNLIASVEGMDELHQRPTQDLRYNRAVLCTGIADLLAGVGSVVGFIPYASSIGFATLTGVLDLLPFILGSVILAVLGLMPAVGSFFAGMPITVGYAVIFSVFIMITGMGVKLASQGSMDTRKTVILGFSVLSGNAISFLPPTAFEFIPAGMTFLLANGLVVAVLIALLLEHVVFRDKVNV
ncbi:MAG: purine/pyrimidine permease [Peptococcaceae bacterium]|nr:purine/pyrimidine permease [Peptococcaceae bacterium]